VLAELANSRRLPSRRDDGAAPDDMDWRLLPQAWLIS
jgi:hypothetical protein